MKKQKAECTGYEFYMFRVRIHQVRGYSLRISFFVGLIGFLHNSI